MAAWAPYARYCRLEPSYLMYNRIRKIDRSEMKTMDEKALAAAYRQVSRAYAELAVALEGNEPGDDKVAREIAVMLEFDRPASRGLNRAEASLAFRRHGFSPRAMGSWIRHGYVTRDGDRRYMSEKGREWVANHQAVAS